MIGLTSLFLLPLFSNCEDIWPTPLWSNVAYGRRWQRSYVPSNLEDILPAIGGAHMALRSKKRSCRDNFCLALVRYFYGWQAAPNNVLGWILDRGYSAALAAKYIVYGISHHHSRFWKMFLEYPLFADTSIVYIILYMPLIVFGISDISWKLYAIINVCANNLVRWLTCRCLL